MYPSLRNFPSGLFDPFERLRREVDNLFGATGLPSSIRAVAPGTLPAVNVGRTSTSAEILVFAPGLDAQKIEVTLDRGVLRIAGERASGIPDNDAKVHVYTRERDSGRFSRTIALPDDIDADHVHANYVDGVLHLSIARREAAQPKRIAVQ